MSEESEREGREVERAESGRTVARDDGGMPTRSVIETTIGGGGIAGER